jgi:hypothetical protein
MVAVTNRTSSALRTECGGRWWLSSKAAAPELSVSAPLRRPAGRGEPGQFAALTAREYALTAREYEVAPGAGPLRAIAVRPQVALPASRALVAAGLIDAHLAHRSPAGSRPGRDTLSAAACPRQRGAASAAQGNLSNPGRIGVSRAPAIWDLTKDVDFADARPDA